MGTTGEQLGVMKLSDALRKAQSLELDLVEVAPTANPPVCKIIDFGKYRYDIAKQEKDRKSSPAAKLKEIKFRVNIDEHDYMTKIRHGEEFLDRGNKVRVQLQFRGREMAHQEFGMQLMAKVKNDLAGMSQVEMEPKLAGRNITMTLSPLPANRRKRRFAPVAETVSPNGQDAPEINQESSIRGRRSAEADLKSTGGLSSWQVGERTRPRVLSLAPRQRLSLN